MQINFTAPINNYDGSGIKVSEKTLENGTKDTEYMTLGSISINALNHIRKQDENLPADKKIHRATLSVLIFEAYKNDVNAGVVDVSIDDISLIQELLVPLYGPLPIMRADNIFDPKPTEVPSKTDIVE